MSTQATAATGHALERSTPADQSRGFWSRLFRGLIAAREREARLRVSQHLHAMPERQLRMIGFNDSDIRTLRTTGMLPEHIDG
ncbi:MAG: hypothetical protein ACR2OV_05300 [Hyphomicrobiaceae bacterium]